MSINKVVIPKYSYNTKSSVSIKKPDPVEINTPEEDVEIQTEEKNKNKKKKDKVMNDAAEVYNIQRKAVLVIIVLFILMCAVCPLIIVCIKKYGSKSTVNKTDVSETFNDIAEDFKDTSVMNGSSITNSHKPSFEIPVPAAHFQKIPDIIEPVKSTPESISSFGVPESIPVNSTTHTSSNINPSTTPVKTITIPSSGVHSSVQPIITKINALNDISDRSKTVKIPTGVEDFF